VALVTRLLFLFSRADAQWPHSVFYEGDAAEWVRWAQALGRGQPYEFNLPLRSPGVAYILYLLGAGDTTLHSYLAWKALWCVMSAATCALAYWGFVMVFPRRVSLIAAGLSVFSFGGYVLATSLNNETPLRAVRVCRTRADAAHVAAAHDGLGSDAGFRACSGHAAAG